VTVRILGIETSCDETAAAVVEDGRNVCSSVVSSQVDLHARYGGVVPEIASRAHVELVNDVIAEALLEAGASLHDIDVVAAAHGPGLAGALLVGVSAAKAIALAIRGPYVGVNHHEAHMYAALIDDPSLEPPFVTLIVSGGHTLLIAMDDHGRYRVLGRTVDDAAGEAFDKVARFLGLGYPGGPAIDRLASQGDPTAIAFPRPMLTDGNDFSFSGLKTAVVLHVRKHPEADVADVADVAASFQAAVVDVLVAKLLQVVEEERVHDPRMATVVIGGGVAANSALRARLLREGERGDVRVVLPSIGLCTDNAAMVASTAWWRLAADGPTSLASGAYPGLRIA
jgi:N6-L-threonylcarbamoyladenine synthase